MSNSIITGRLERLTAELLYRPMMERISSMKITTASGALDYLATPGNTPGLSPLVPVVARGLHDMFKRPSISTGWAEGTGLHLLNGTAASMVEMVAEIVVKMENDLEWRLWSLIKDESRVHTAQARARQELDAGDSVREFITSKGGSQAPTEEIPLPCQA